MTNILTGLNLIKTTLDGIIWSGGTRVFGLNSVRITNSVDLKAQKEIRLPMVMIRPGSFAVDPEHGEEPDLVLQRVRLRLIVQHLGDAIGELVLIGGHRTGGLIATKGRGLLEIEPEIFRAIRFLNVKDALTIQLMSSSGIGSELDDRLGSVAAREYEFGFWATLT